MTARLATLRTALQPHLVLFAPAFRTAIEELLQLAAVGERAQELVASLTMTGNGANAPAKSRAGRRSVTAKQARGKRTSANVAPTGEPAATPARATSKETAKAPSLRMLIADVLREAGKPLSLTEIEVGVKARGHVSKSAAFGKILALTITKMKPEVRRVDRGVYTLAS